MPSVRLLAALLAQTAPEAGPNPIATYLMIGAMIVVIYFMLMRPQQKEKKKHEDFLSTLKKGDEVATTGGMLGKVYEVKGTIVALEVSNNVRVRVLKSQIAGLARPEGDEAKSDAKPADAKEEKNG